MIGKVFNKSCDSTPEFARLTLERTASWSYTLRTDDAVLGSEAFVRYSEGTDGRRRPNFLKLAQIASRENCLSWNPIVDGKRTTHGPLETSSSTHRLDGQLYLGDDAPDSCTQISDGISGSGTFEEISGSGIA